MVYGIIITQTVSFVKWALRNATEIKFCGENFFEKKIFPAPLSKSFKLDKNNKYM